MDIKNIRFRELRNSEYFQYMMDLQKIIVKYSFIGDVLTFLVTELKRLLGIAEVAILAERRNDLVRQKNEADRRRDALHSRLFNYLKYVMGDVYDQRFDDAQKIRQILNDAGNPTNLSENAQSAMMTALATKLQPHTETLIAIGAKETVDDMIAANQLFIAINDELRAMVAAKKLDPEQASMTVIRKEIDRHHVAIMGILNGYTMAKKEESAEMITEINVLISKFDALLAARKREKKDDNKKESCEECGK